MPQSYEFIFVLGSAPVDYFFLFPWSRPSLSLLILHAYLFIMLFFPAN